MMLTKECDYGLRIMRTLGDKEIRTVQTICDIEHIPYKFAYKILKKLQNAGLIQSKRGPEGGYFLLMPLSDFTMYDVINAVDERLFLFECLMSGAKCPLNAADTPCSIHSELARLQKLLIAEMKSKSMEEILP